jgi:hypothetical protein
MFIHNRKLIITGTLYQKSPQTMIYHGLSLSITARLLMTPALFLSQLALSRVESKKRVGGYLTRLSRQWKCLVVDTYVLSPIAIAIRLKTDFEDP